jgi:hypothetical protein
LGVGHAGKKPTFTSSWADTVEQNTIRAAMAQPVVDFLGVVLIGTGSLQLIQGSLVYLVT